MLRRSSDWGSHSILKSQNESSALLAERACNVMSDLSGRVAVASGIKAMEADELLFESGSLGIGPVVPQWAQGRLCTG